MVEYEKVDAPEYTAGSSFFAALFKQVASHVGGVAAMELWYKVPACPTGMQRLTHCHLRKKTVTCDPLQLHSSWSKGQHCSRVVAAALKRIADHAEHGEVNNCLPGVGLAGIMAAKSTCNSKNSLEWCELCHLVNDPEEFVDEHAKDAAEAFEAVAAVEVGVGGAVLLVFEEKLPHICKDTTAALKACALHSKNACRRLSSFARALAPLLEGGFCHSIMEDLQQHQSLEGMSNSGESGSQIEEEDEDEHEENSKPTLVRTYFRKMAGATNELAPRQCWREAALTWTGVASFLLLTSGLNGPITDNSETYFLFMGSLGAEVFLAPNSPLVQPRNIVGGNLLSASISILFHYITGEDFVPLLPKWVALALAPATAIALMAKTGLTHPPAGSICLVFLAGSKNVHNLGWQFLAMPVLATCVLGILLAMLVNNLSPKRQYPVSWGLPSWIFTLLKRVKSSPPNKDRQATAKETDVEYNTIVARSKPSLDEGVDKTKTDSNSETYGVSAKADSSNEAYGVFAEADTYSETSSAELIDV